MSLFIYRTVKHGKDDKYVVLFCSILNSEFEFDILVMQGFDIYSKIILIILIENKFFVLNYKSKLLTLKIFLYCWDANKKWMSANIVITDSSDGFSHSKGGSVPGTLGGRWEEFTPG